MTTPRPADGAVAAKLSAMMFLQFFVWGAWYVTVGNYMQRKGMGDSIGDAYTVGPIAALISPFFLGLIADRFFATEKVLALMHLLGALAIAAAGYLAETGQASTTLFVGLLLVHMLCYMPTLGLTNTLAFHQLTDRERQFPVVRVFGTIGWIAANVLVSKVLKADERVDPFYVAAGAGLLLAVFSLALPHTPPPAKGTPASLPDILGLRAVSLLKDRSFAVFSLCSLLLCIPLAGYYAFAPVYVNHAGFENPAFSMTFGQVSEIVFMLLMPLCFARLGVKWMLLIGMLAWVLRYTLFSAAADDRTFWMIMGGIVLHGVCYDFFFVTGFIYADRHAPREIRGQAQGFLVLITQGLGLGIGARVVQAVVSHNKLNEPAPGLTRVAGQLVEAAPYADLVSPAARATIADLPARLAPAPDAVASILAGHEGRTIAETIKALNPLESRTVRLLAESMGVSGDRPASALSDALAQEPDRATAAMTGFNALADAAVKADVAARAREVAASLRSAADATPDQADAIRRVASAIWDSGTDLYMDSTDWANVWLYAATAALAVAVLFTLLFRDPNAPRRADDNA